jgi:hypothetical protein
MRIVPAVFAGAVLAVLSGAAAARDNVSFSVSFGMPAPVYVTPAPVYVPAPTYYAPPPAYYPPTTVYYAPAPAPVYAPYVVRVAPAYVVPGHGHGHGRGHGRWHGGGHWR